MPNCTVERNRLGSCASASAALGALVALFGALLQADLAGRDDGNLRHGEDAVGEDEQEDDEDFGADADNSTPLGPDPNRPFERYRAEPRS